METRDDMTVSMHMRGAVIPTSVSKGFLRACTLRSVAYSSTLHGIINAIWGLDGMGFFYYEESIFLPNAFCSSSVDGILL